MFYAVLGLHLFLCVILITLVLLQQGKGASAGAVFGGSSNTLFGAAGANTVLTKVTTGVAVSFMITSVILVKLYTGFVAAQKVGGSALQGSVMSEHAQAAAAAAPVEEAAAPVTAAQKVAGPEAVVPVPRAASAPAPVAPAPVAAADVPKDKK